MESLRVGEWLDNSIFRGKFILSSETSGHAPLIVTKPVMSDKNTRIMLEDFFKKRSILLEPSDIVFMGEKEITLDSMEKIKGTIQKYAVTGKVRVPHKNGVQSVQMNAVIVLKKEKNSYPDKFEIVDCEGETSIGAWDMTESIVLSDTWVRLSYRGGKTAVHISGTLRLSGCEGFETGGDLDTEILTDPKDPDRMFLGTLVKNASLNIGKNIRLQGGTIRFEFCSKPYAPGSPFPYQIDEMDELLFQCTDPVPLGAMYIVGVGSNPVTMSMNIIALSPGNVRAFISLYPARIHVPMFGENTILFLSGEAKENIVEMDVKNEWSAFISSSPRLHLVDPLDPDGPPLVECTCLLTGRLECRGISHARLSLSSPLDCATAFTRSKWPQELPYQNISFLVSETGVPQLDLVFNPLKIDGFLIYSAEGNDKHLIASLDGNGLAFKGKFLVSHEPSGNPPRLMPPFIVDIHCRVWVLAADKKIEIREWMTD
jgi:hypothetical protein